MTYTSPPPKSRKSACIAWDFLSTQRSPATIVHMWFARFGPLDSAWAAEYTDGEFEECDSLCVRDRINNPHKYAKQDLIVKNFIGKLP